MKKFALNNFPFSRISPQIFAQAGLSPEEKKLIAEVEKNYAFHRFSFSERTTSISTPARFNKEGVKAVGDVLHTREFQKRCGFETEWIETRRSESRPLGILSLHEKAQKESGKIFINLGLAHNAFLKGYWPFSTLYVLNAFDCNWRPTSDSTI